MSERLPKPTDGSTFSCKTTLHHNVWCNTTQNLCDTLLNHSGLRVASHGSGLSSDHSEAIKCTWFWNVALQRSSVAVCLQSDMVKWCVAMIPVWHLMLGALQSVRAILSPGQNQSATHNFLYTFRKSHRNHSSAIDQVTPLWSNVHPSYQRDTLTQDQISRHRPARWNYNVLLDLKEVVACGRGLFLISEYS